MCRGRNRALKGAFFVTIDQGGMPLLVNLNSAVLLANTRTRQKLVPLLMQLTTQCDLKHYSKFVSVTYGMSYNLKENAKQILTPAASDRFISL